MTSPEPAIPPHARAAITQVVMQYEPEATRALIQSPQQLASMLLEVGRRSVEAAAPHLAAAEDVGGFPQAYPIQYKVLALKDGAVLKMGDARGRKAEIVLSADDARVLALGLLGALPAQGVSGALGSENPPPGNGSAREGRP